MKAIEFIELYFHLVLSVCFFPRFAKSHWVFRIVLNIAVKLIYETGAVVSLTTNKH